MIFHACTVFLTRCSVRFRLRTIEYATLNLPCLVAKILAHPPENHFVRGHNIITMKYLIISLVRMFQNALMAQPDGRLLRRSLINYVLALGGSCALVIIANGVAIMAGIPAEALETPGVKINLRDFISAVVFAPLVETLILAALLALMPRRWGI